MFCAISPCRDATSSIFRVNCFPQICVPSATLTSSACTVSVSPRSVMWPVTTASTFNVAPACCGSLSFPLNRNTVLLAMTRNPGTCDRLLMTPSVIPSARYSSFPSPTLSAKGSTARLSTVVCALLSRSVNSPNAAHASTTSVATPIQSFCCADLAAGTAVEERDATPLAPAGTVADS